MNLIDNTVIARSGSRQILRQRAEVLWKDGTSVQLHTVWVHGFRNLFERALDLGSGRFALFELPRVVSSLDAEMRGTADRDIQGVVFYTLREVFSTAADFKAAAVKASHLVVDTNAPQPPALMGPRPRAFDGAHLDAANHETRGLMDTRWMTGRRA